MFLGDVIMGREETVLENDGSAIVTAEIIDGEKQSIEKNFLEP